jgi:hypothetical protein
MPYFGTLQVFSCTKWTAWSTRARAADSRAARRGAQGVWHPAVGVGPTSAATRTTGGGATSNCGSEITVRGKGGKPRIVKVSSDSARTVERFDGEGTARECIAPVDDQVLFKVKVQRWRGAVRVADGGIP